LAESIWVGRDEHEGVRAQPRKDLEPPPHWRLEAIARTPRPRSTGVVVFTPRSPVGEIAAAR
jgi:hypothetical protein